MKSCPPKIAVQAYFLEGLDLLDLRQHIETCATCGEIGKTLETDRASFLQRYPLSRFLEETQERRKSFVRRIFDHLVIPRSLGAVLTLAGLAGLMLVTLRSPNSQSPEELLIQTKGGIGLSFFVTPGGPKGKIQPGKDGMNLASGADIQFVYSNEDNPYLYLIGIEQNGDMTTYFPDHGVMSGAISAGSHVKLPQALRWEPKSHYERFYALFSKEPIGLEEVRIAVSQMATEGKTVEQTTKLPLPFPQASILVHRKNAQ